MVIMLSVRHILYARPGNTFQHAVFSQYIVKLEKALIFQTPRLIFLYRLCMFLKPVSLITRYVLVLQPLMNTTCLR